MSKITLIGSGKMALAIAKGVSKNYQVEVIGRDTQKLLEFSKQVETKIKTTLYQDANIDGKTAILCIKPYALEQVSSTLKGRARTLYSVLASTSLEQLKTINADTYLRAMPNVAAEFSKSMTTIAGDSSKKSEAQKLFSAIGRTLWVESEKELDIATILAGSGPAFLALIAEALSDGGVKQGLKREDANTLIKGLFDGFTPLIEQKHPALIKDDVMSPGGVTAAGYGVIEKNGVRGALIEAVEVAIKRSFKKKGG